MHLQQAKQNMFQGHGAMPGMMTNMPYWHQQPAYQLPGYHQQMQMGGYPYQMPMAQMQQPMAQMQ